MGNERQSNVAEEEEEEEEEEKKWWSSIGSIFMHADGVDKCLMGLGFFGAVADGFSTPLLLYVTSRLMNDIGSASSLDPEMFCHKINKNALVLLCMACGLLFACFLEGYCWTRTGERQAQRMRARYLRAVLRQDVTYFDMHVMSTSEVVTSVSSDSLVIQDVLSEKVPNFLVNASLFVGSYIVAFLMLWRLAIVGFPFALLLIIPGMICGRTLIIIARKKREEYNKAGTIAEQAVSSIRTVYAFVGESKTLSEFSKALEGSVKLGLRQGLAKELAIGSNSIVFAIWSFMAYYGSRMVMYHGYKGRTVYAVGTSITFGGMALGSALSNLKYFSEASSAGERISEVMKRVLVIDPENMEGNTIQNLEGNIEFKHVEFAYPSRPENIIFRDFSLTIPSGKTLALVGGSGSGKSTVIWLLQRFYNPLSGEILLDGIAISKLQIKWLRSQMGLVSQEPTLFATSIKENILFGKEDAKMEEVIEATKASNAHNFISQLPQGYNTQVGDRGIQLSGGQKQRIAIARAIIKAPRILLLDEATTSIDRTTIIIAHRLSTIRHAYNIAVIWNGQVIETGNHEELIQSEDGLYTSLKPEIQITSSMLIMDGNSASSHPSLSKASRSSSARSMAAVVLDDQKIPVPSFRRLIALNMPEWKQVITGCISAILSGAVQPACSFTMGSMVWVYFLQDHEEIKAKIRIYAFCFLGLAVFSLSVNVSQHYNFAFMGEYLTKRIREKMLSNILTFEVGWFDQDQNSRGSVCSRFANDANVVRSLVGDQMALIVQTCSAIIIAFTMGLIIAWRLALVVIVSQPLTIVCFFTRRMLLKAMSEKAGKAQDDSSKLAADAVSNHRTITSFSSQERILNMLKKTQEAPERESIRQSWYAGIALAASQFFTKCAWALDFWYGGKLISQGQITSKELFETFLVLISIGRVIADAGSITTDLAKGSDTIRSVFTILDRQTRIEPEDMESYQPRQITGHVEFCRVDFAYPERPDVIILKDFSFNIEAGKSTALVGQSGSGKSTLISLIERFYDPIRGVVKIDGRDVRSYHLRALRKQIALVSQEPTLFAGTIRENIVYGISLEMSETEVVEAARAANAHDFIMAFKDGYHTWCGDKGIQLSGGQKQRVAIARAILRNPTLLLLDEATSALDSQSEEVVQDALERLMVGRTTLMIAHRLSTIQACDMIAVLDRGKVVEKGSHSSLLAKGPAGAYYSLVNLQRASSISECIE
ncbi:hypothetical protein ACJRO7_035396 [Eucalyptus globulus]|uniref:ABC transporter B family member 15 n=1 Tax=Eucalyptus globulus TaxID=34317 RepID=A0ABD3J8T3_EUCGL